MPPAWPTRTRPVWVTRKSIRKETFWFLKYQATPKPDRVLHDLNLDRLTWLRLVHHAFEQATSLIFFEKTNSTFHMKVGGPESGKKFN